MTDTSRLVHIFGVPMDLGQQRRGVDMGVSAIRYAGLQRALEGLGCVVRDYGNIAAPILESLDQLDHDASDGLAHNADAIMDVCTRLYDALTAPVRANEIVVVLGGDHSVSLGSVAADLQRPGKLGVLWVDAHGDFNTPFTTPSGNVHGMVVAALMGRCPPPLVLGDVRLNPDQIAMIGTRDLDPDEKAALRECGVKVVTMSDIDRMGIAAATVHALDGLRDCDALHISLDLDSLDPDFAPGVGTPVSGGLTYREAHLIMEMLADDGRVRSLDIVEVNPILDVANRTASVAVELAASLFGKRIL